MSKILIDEATVQLALEAAYLAGWSASGEGYNAEYPFSHHARNPEEDAVWIKDRDNALQEALAEQAQRKPLTDEEIKDIRVACGSPLAIHIEFARAIEAAHGIKENT